MSSILNEESVFNEDPVSKANSTPTLSKRELRRQRVAKRNLHYTSATHSLRGASASRLSDDQRHNTATPNHSDDYMLQEASTLWPRSCFSETNIRSQSPVRQERQHHGTHTNNDLGRGISEIQTMQITHGLFA